MTTAARSRGFTLVEALIALAILAVALAAASRAIAVATDSAGISRARLFAQWVAENRINEMRARRQWPEVGESTGTERQGPMEFSWRQTVSGTPNPDFRRVEVKVSDPKTPEHSLASVVGYAVQQ